MTLPSSSTDREAIKKSLVEISDSYTRMEAEKDLIKDIVTDVCEQYQLSKKTFRKLARTYHKQNFSKEVAEHEEFEEMYETLTGTTTLKDI